MAVVQIFELKRALVPHSVIFAIGEALKGNTNAKERTVFGTPAHEDRWRRVMTAVSYCEEERALFRRAVLTWRLISKQMPFCRNVSLIIAVMLWDLRLESPYY